MKNFRVIFLSVMIVLTVLSLCAFQDPEDGMILSNPNTDPVFTVNPMTGLPVTDPDLLLVPPIFIPITRYPSTYRPSSGHSQAQWVFEMYVSGEESRPILMFYGDTPSGNVARLSSAIYGLEQLRVQYRGMIIAGGTSKSILDAGIYNLETWYGVNGNQVYPVLPLENFEHIRDKWKNKILPADPNNLTYSFDETPPEGGVAADSLYFRYAKANQILWRYDETTGKYYRMQNTIEDPYSLVEDVDSSNSQQVGVDNLIILMAHHDWAPNQDHAYGLFTVNFNFVESNQALIFRNGKLYNATWSTYSDLFEKETDRMRPIRFYDFEGNNFRLKPGQTWIHVIMPGNPYYEVDGELGSEIMPASGHWKIPYISFKPGSIETVINEVSELNQFDIHLNEVSR